MILLAAFAVAVAVVSLAAFFGATWWSLDLVSSFRPQYAVTLLVAGSLLLVRRWRRLGSAVLLAGVVNAAVVAPLFLGSPATGGDDAFRVLSFNVHSSNDAYGAVVDYIRRTEPDVVFLHEATRLWEESLAQAGLGYEIVPGRDGLIFGTLALVPPGAAARTLGFGVEGRRAVEVVAPGPGGETISLLGIHPVSPVNEHRSALRDAQLDFAAEWAASRDGPVVVAGDFNATPWSAAFRRFVDDSGLRSSQTGFGIQASFPADSNPAVRIPIDHLLVSEGLGVRDRRLGPALGSDHFPLLVDLVLGM